MLRHIAKISKYRFDIDISYRPRKYQNFRYTGIDFLIYHLAEFSRVVSRSREIFIETFIKTFTVSESFNENFNENFTTSWHHTWKFGKRITEFFIVRKFREILHYYRLVRISKATISRRIVAMGPHRGHTRHNSTQLNLLMYGSCEAGLNKHREHIIKHKA